MLLAELFRYPSKEMKAYLGKWKDLILISDPELMLKFELFANHIHNKPLSFQQEYYISTFDVQALCFLDIGYVLYGEDYKRGVFLVNIKKEQIKASNDCGRELPDHLPNILTLLSKMQDQDLVEELIYSILIPAVHEMILKFSRGNNLYQGLLEILVTIMEADYPESSYERFNFGVRKKTDHFESSSEGKDMPYGCNM